MRILFGGLIKGGCNGHRETAKRAMSLQLNDKNAIRRQVETIAFGSFERSMNKRGSWMTQVFKIMHNIV